MSTLTYSFCILIALILGEDLNEVDDGIHYLKLEALLLRMYYDVFK